MTLVIGAATPESIWLLSDRRLTFGDGTTRDDARKLLVLDTTDGVAILGYAGLGLTAGDTEPSDWMSRALTGRNLPMERSLSVLRDAAVARLPEHLDRLNIVGISGHGVLVPSFIDRQHRLYTIMVARRPGDAEYRHVFQRNVIKILPNGTEVTVPIMYAGSGGIFLSQNDRLLKRGLLRLIAAHDSGRISPNAVAREFAKINDEVARHDPTVSDRCVVAWRFREGGGGLEFFSGTEIEQQSSLTWIPSIARGMDLTGVIRTTVPFTHIAEFVGEQQREFDVDVLNAELAKLPDGPDDSLK